MSVQLLMHPYQWHRRPWYASHQPLAVLFPTRRHKVQHFRTLGRAHVRIEGAAAGACHHNQPLAFYSVAASGIEEPYIIYMKTMPPITGVTICEEENLMLMQITKPMCASRACYF